MTYRRDLWHLASSNHGIFTVKDAENEGVPAVEVRKLANRKKVQRVGQGVYRHLDVPADEYTPYAVAVATVGKGAFLEWDSVLSLNELADMDPPFIRVGVTRRYRGNHRALIKIEQDIAENLINKVTYYKNIPGVTIAHALEKAIHKIPVARIKLAAFEANERNLLSSEDLVRIKDLLSEKGGADD